MPSVSAGGDGNEHYLVRGLVVNVSSNETHIASFMLICELVNDSFHLFRFVTLKSQTPTHARKSLAISV